MHVVRFCRHHRRRLLSTSSFASLRMDFFNGIVVSLLMALLVQKKLWSWKCRRRRRNIRLPFALTPYPWFGCRLRHHQTVQMDAMPDQFALSECPAANIASKECAVECKRRFKRTNKATIVMHVPRDRPAILCEGWKSVCFKYNMYRMTADNVMQLAKLRNLKCSTCFQWFFTFFHSSHRSLRLDGRESVRPKTLLLLLEWRTFISRSIACCGLPPMAPAFINLVDFDMISVIGWAKNNKLEHFAVACVLHAHNYLLMNEFMYTLNFASESLFTTLFERVFLSICSISIVAGWKPCTKQRDERLAGFFFLSVWPLHSYVIHYVLLLSSCCFSCFDATAAAHVNIWSPSQIISSMKMYSKEGRIKKKKPAENFEWSRIFAMWM